MRLYMSSKAKAGWLIMSGVILGAAIHAVTGNLGVVGGGSGIGVRLPSFILSGVALVLASYGIYWIGQRVERWHQNHHQPSAVSNNPS
jgi:hypothetical protein